MRYFVLTCLLALAACQTNPETQLTRTYSADLVSVVAAAKHAVVDADLVLAAEQTSGAGVILIAQRKEATNFGGNVTVYIDSESDGTTVRVVCARVVSVNGEAANDPSGDILTFIGRRLPPRRFQ